MTAWLPRRSRVLWASASMLVRTLGNMHPQPEAMIARHGMEITAGTPLLGKISIVAPGDAHTVQRKAAR